MLLKIILWTPYCFTMIFLGWIAYWLRIRFLMTAHEAFLVVSAVVFFFYGALLVGSADLRRKYWPKAK